MNPLTHRSREQCEWHEIPVCLGELLRELPGRTEGSPGAVRTVEVQIPNRDLLEWLAGRSHPLRQYWSRADASLRLAGVGSIDEVVCHSPEEMVRSVKRIEHAVASTSGVRYFGGSRFDIGIEPSDEWREFGVARFRLPRIELIQQHGQTVLRCLLRADEDPVAALDEIATLDWSDHTSPTGLTSAIDSTCHPDRERWLEAVKVAIDSFGTNGLEKVVLSRQHSWQFERPCDPLLLLLALSAKTANCFHAAFAIDKNLGFITATPERLFVREGRRLRTEALAGTRRRGVNTDEDSSLAEQLLVDPKERAEHGFVLTGIGDSLARLSSGPVEVNGDHPAVRPLARVQHLVVPIEATLREDITDADILEELHPTPAVNGWPREAAVRFLRQHESFDRGWYAGPIGWLGNEGAEFAVGIRSALVNGREVTATAGAGIVAASNPEREWRETEAKLATLTECIEQPE